MAYQQVVKEVDTDVPVDVFSFEKFTAYVPADATGTIKLQLDYGDGAWSAGTTIAAGAVLTVTDLALRARFHGATWGAHKGFIRGLYTHDGG